MELDESTKSDIEALSQITGQEPEQIVAQAVENFMEQTGKQLIRQQAQQNNQYPEKEIEKKESAKE